MDADSRLTLKFWIAALAFSVLLLATTFAVMATYLAEIRSDTASAVIRADMIAQRLYILDAGIMSLNRQMIEQRAAAKAAATPQPENIVLPADPAVAEPLVKDVTPPELLKNAPAAPVAKLPRVTPPGLIPAAKDNVEMPPKPEPESPASPPTSPLK